MACLSLTSSRMRYRTPFLRADGPTLGDSTADIAIHAFTRNGGNDAVGSGLFV